jgi:predicted dehydrogenase
MIARGEFWFPHIVSANARSAKMNTYKVGVIGCGRIASLMEQDEHRGKPTTHAGCYDLVQRTQIVAAADSYQERLQAFGRRWNVQRLYSSYEEMMDSEELDIVSICTYPIPHRDITMKVATSGVKAIFCEKAMATCLREAEEMVAVCDQNNVKLTINHTRRWDWRYRKAKEFIDNGEIGQLLGITLYFGGALGNMGTHYFDMMRFFAGDVAWAVGHLSNPESLDPGGSGYFYFRNGVRGIVNGAAGYNASFLYELLGSKGRLTISESRRPAEFRLYVGDNGLREKAFPELPEEAKTQTIGSGRCVIPLAVEEIIQSIEQDEETISTGRDGYASLEMLLSFHESERNGNNRVDFPMQNKGIRVLVRDPGFISSAVPAS